MRPALTFALLASSLLAVAMPASAGLQDRVDSAGQFLYEGLDAFGRLDPVGMYESLRGYESREGAAAAELGDHTAGFAFEQVSSLGPVGDAATGVAGDVIGVVSGESGNSLDATRHAANTCGDGLFPGLGASWEVARGVCLAQRHVAEVVLGQPLPEL